MSPGPTRRGRTGQIGKGSTHLIKIACEAAVGKRRHVAVYGNDYPTPDGTCIRDYIHVSDLAAAHVAALEWLVEHPGENLAMNCGYGKGLSVLEVLDAVDRLTNKPVKRVIEGRRAGDPPELVAANHRLLETLEWRPPMPTSTASSATRWRGSASSRKRPRLSPIFTAARLLRMRGLCLVLVIFVVSAFAPRSSRNAARRIGSPVRSVSERRTAGAWTAQS